ncbi:inhibitor of growth protein 1 [Cricetulus griseus]|nr:inhibitor of growth protein 1 [Cricetulus griseus]
MGNRRLRDSAGGHRGARSVFSMIGRRGKSRKGIGCCRCQFRPGPYLYRAGRRGNAVSLEDVDREILKELDDYYEKFKRETDGTQKRRVLHCIQRALIRSQELGDEKIQIVSQMVELVENRTRKVDSHVELFEAHQDISESTGSSGKACQDKSKTTLPLLYYNRKCSLVLL